MSHGLVPLAAALALLASAAICGPAEEDGSNPITGTTTDSLETSPSPVPAQVTETPLPALTPASVFGFDETADLPSPTSSTQAMLLSGVLWVDARPAIGEVAAFIGEMECGTGQSLLLPDGGPSNFLIEIASNSERPGCGTPGAEIVLTIGGRAMNEPIGWRPGLQQPLNVISGPAFTQYQGTIRFDSSLIPLRVVPYVGTIACGEQLNGFQGTNEVFYHVVADPEELRSGCGRAGGAVVLRLEGTSGSGTPVDIVLDTVAWAPGTIVEPPVVDVAQSGSTTPVPTAGQPQ